MSRRVLIIAVVLFAAVAVGVWAWLRPRSVPPPPSPVLWTFEAPRPGGVVAAPLITDTAVYVAAVHPRVEELTGAVYALDPATGKPVWTYDDGGAMLAPGGSPVWAAGRVLVGEGMHADFRCRLHALDPATGRRAWVFPATDHIEAAPRADGGAVYLTAGNDGAVCLNAATGDERWRFADRFHADCTPAVFDGLAVIGTGPSRRFRTTEVIGLDTTTGRPRWRTPVPLPAWGSPVAAGGRVYAALGNGRLTRAAEWPERPAGAVVCLDPANGNVVWTYHTPDAVFCQPAVAGGVVAFGDRSGVFRGVDAATGEEKFALRFGSPVMADPEADGDVCYVCSVGGRAAAVHLPTGREVWRWEMADHTRSAVRVYAAPRVHAGRLYLAAEVSAGTTTTAALFCLTLPSLEPPGGE